MSQVKPLPSRFFTVKGVDFEITGTETDPKGNVLDHVKNLSNGKWNRMGRSRLLSFIKTANP